jgi:hypothetical protein
MDVYVVPLTIAEYYLNLMLDLAILKIKSGLSN